ncbi:hypothetical protein GV794_06835 [Nocardia cyriacigeorgica]|uniref:Uncharacterized protein n=1 Tax=Nocardia cyriacigeorgica TaxID=135487 RepID=A0A6P1D8T5_9NOCA|nr:hypothetical protein [Nocardia cyriacigeorgica]NEW39910.1 hypothetical protein [Nocardia cyriacigeorgica]NEW45654.1 hypothetical protein [Nocardia cyriacigeorgica]NEW51393.1 hypothetical protein [Nocardia cyriacigeorgica]NEW55371.1 hypothetical protein [Nocardia cyriacigeorgica]
MGAVPDSYSSDPRPAAAQANLVSEFSDPHFRRLMQLAVDLSPESHDLLAGFARRFRVSEGLLPDPLWE